MSGFGLFVVKEKQFRYHFGLVIDCLIHNKNNIYVKILIWTLSYTDKNGKRFHCKANYHDFIGLSFSLKCPREVQF